jgi:hypothetical protein
MRSGSGAAGFGAAATGPARARRRAQRRGGAAARRGGGRAAERAGGAAACGGEAAAAGAAAVFGRRFLPGASPAQALGYTSRTTASISSAACHGLEVTHVQAETFAAIFAAAAHEKGVLGERRVFRLRQAPSASSTRSD